MDDNKKFSIREYREALYGDIIKKKKEQRKKWQVKYLQKLGVEEFIDKGDKHPAKVPEDDLMKSIMSKNEEKYHRPVTSSSSKHRN